MSLQDPVEELLFFLFYMLDNPQNCRIDFFKKWKPGSFHSIVKYPSCATPGGLFRQEYEYAAIFKGM